MKAIGRLPLQKNFILRLSSFTPKDGSSAKNKGFLLDKEWVQKNTKGKDKFAEDRSTKSTKTKVDPFKERETQPVHSTVKTTALLEMATPIPKREESESRRGYGENNSSRGRDGDIHSARYMAMENQGIAEQKIKQASPYQFYFNRIHEKAVPVFLDDINIINIDNEETFDRVPVLQHKLDVVVQNPGIYTMDQIGKLLKDKGDFLRRIPQPDEIDFDRIPGYKTPSNDPLLIKFAKETKTKYIMSTSTISAALSQMYYLYSGFKSPSFEALSSDYEFEPHKFMVSQRKPSCNLVRCIDKQAGIYAVESDPGIFKNKYNILSDLGKIMERQLTMTKEEFEKSFVKGKVDPELHVTDDHHRFMKLNNNICLRSQIDCRSVDADGKPKVFEIKTRGTAPIRYDLANYSQYLDYVVSETKGKHSSFEREYYDLIRGGFMKYSFQLKIGRMDGAFVAYHNTLENFGFEYIKTKEIEKRMFGSNQAADLAFVCCSKLITTLLDEIIKDLSHENYSLLRIGYYADGINHRMTIFSEVFYDLDSWTSKDLIDETESLRHEYDFYSKVWKDRPRKVFKYIFNVAVYVNGVRQTTPDYRIGPNDMVEMKYSLEKVGKAPMWDYMNFLHEAYKFDSNTISMNYIGTWIKELNH